MFKRCCSIFLVLALALSGCASETDDDNNGNNDTRDTQSDLDSTTDDGDDLDGESCELTCDALFVPPVTVHVETADGEDYCGDGVSVRSWKEGTEPPTDWFMCECSDMGRDAGAPTNNPGLVRGDYQCYVNAEPGETTVVEMKAAGYDALQQTVELPCTCNPQDRVTFELPN